MNVTTLLGDLSPNDFVRDIYQRLPHSGRFALADLDGFDVWQCIVRNVTKGQADYMICRRNELQQAVQPKTEAEMISLSAEGFTFLVRQAERDDAWLNQVANQFEKDFASPVDIHLYSTPAGAYGFGWHYDAEDVFILQTQGEKSYELRKNTVHPWPVEESIPENMRYEREVMPHWRCTLSAGGWLYIPSGYWHRATAETASQSISIGLMPRTAIEFWDFFRTLLPHDLIWRQRLPPLGAAATADRSETISELARMLASLQNEAKSLFANPRMAEKFLDYLQSRMPPKAARTDDPSLDEQPIPTVAAVHPNPVSASP